MKGIIYYGDDGGVPQIEADEGETVVVGDTDKVMSEPLFGDEVRYELLCRRHYVAGDIGPSK